MKKIIHSLTIVDKSSSMEQFKSRTIEGINSSISELRKQADKDTEILNTLLFFSGGSNNNWALSKIDETNFVFNRVGSDITTINDLTNEEYNPGGNTPLLDSIGIGVDKVKKFHGDKLGDDNLNIIVTIFTDGEENSSTKYNKAEIKKMIEHFQSDNRWTFTFIGCGSLENVTSTSNTLGISSANTVAYTMSDAGTAEAYSKIGTSFSNYATATKRGIKDDTLFMKKD